MTLIGRIRNICSRTPKGDFHHSVARRANVPAAHAFLAMTELENRAAPIFVAVCTYPMRRFAFAHGVFQRIYSNPGPRSVQFIALLLSFPCFYASYFFFKFAYSINHRRLLKIGLHCASLGGKNHVVECGDLSPSVTAHQLIKRLNDLRCRSESETESLQRRLDHLSSQLGLSKTDLTVRESADT